MNSEETIIMQPQNRDKAEQTQSVEAPENNRKTGRGKKAATTAAAAVMGGVVGGGATYAAMSTLHNTEPEEQKPEEPAAEEPVVATAEKPQKEQHDEPQKEDAAVKVDEDAGTETDYTGNNGADPVATSQQTHADVADGNGTNEVQVLGVYEAQGENGQTMQAAVLTNGEDVAAVVDVDGDGVADVLVVDENHNRQIDEGEVYDLSDDHVQMADYQQLYLAQQEQAQQEQGTLAYNASDEQPDYCNDADPVFV